MVVRSRSLEYRIQSESVDQVQARAGVLLRNQHGDTGELSRRARRGKVMDRKQIQDQLDWLASEYWEWAYLISKVRVYREVEGIGTMASDGHWRIYWDPALDWDDMETRTVVAHELGHIFGDDG